MDLAVIAQTKYYVLSFTLCKEYHFLFKLYNSMPYIIKKLKEFLEPYSFALICLSGGLDSCLLLKEVNTIMGEKVQAITFKSPLQTQRSINDAKICADLLRIVHLVVDYEPLTDEGIKTNNKYRCLLCKTKMFSIAYGLISHRQKKSVILDGTHLGDDPESRPGMRANKAFGIQSPWKVLGLGKDELRSLARKRGLPIWERPSDSCLGTRFPLGYRLTVKILGQLDSAEEALRDLGLEDFRLRPADSPPRLLLSNEDHHRALEVGFDKIRDAIEEKTGWDLADFCLDIKS